ncbi:MAG TPA: CinA family protein [Gammaproteobacteria bacterium]|nr:CinA family protein [Gammaproteobacteria bacterium]
MKNDPASDDLQAIASALLARNEKLVTAESCTGGWLAKVCTDLPGSSQWFERGYVTYSNDAKIECLGVQPSTLRAHGAVSEACVREMAEGALRAGRSQWTLAITGIAGPDGGTQDKPVGTIWLACATRNAVTISRRMNFSGGREAIRLQSVQSALALLRERLSQ